jgi:hypothetical protein
LNEFGIPANASFKAINAKEVIVGYELGKSTKSYRYDLNEGFLNLSLVNGFFYYLSA